MTKILAIITLYHPENDLIEKLVKSSLAYVGCDVFLSDNADYSAEFLNNPRIIYHKNPNNIGLGAAQNLGLKLALEKNYDYVVLFDQDTQIENNFIANLIREFELACQNDPNIIAAGPAFTDPRYTKGRWATRDLISENRYLIRIMASGTIIVVPALKQIGLMDEELFVDYVDAEWCFRVHSKGYRIVQLARAVMAHQIGEVKTLWWGIKLKYYKTSRYYYFSRNCMMLFKKPYIPIKHRLMIVFKNSLHVLKIPLLDHRWERIKLIFKGIRDGIKS